MDQNRRNSTNNIFFHLESVCYIVANRDGNPFYRLFHVNQTIWHKNGKKKVKIFAARTDN
jgi:hypothetical protein